MSPIEKHLAQRRCLLATPISCFSGGLPMQQHIVDHAYPLYDAVWEHDACGTGFLAQISGDASHELVLTALEALTRLTHRGAQDADAETSDGAGLLTQTPRPLSSRNHQPQEMTFPDPHDLAIGR